LFRFLCQAKGELVKVNKIVAQIEDIKIQFERGLQENNVCGREKKVIYKIYPINQLSQLFIFALI